MLTDSHSQRGAFTNMLPDYLIGDPNMLDTTTAVPIESPPHTEIRALLATMDEPSARRYFAARAQDKLLKSTIGVCNSCLKYCAALIFQRDKKVWITAYCLSHGHATSLVENDSEFYRLSNKDICGIRYTNDRVFDIPQYSGCCGKEASCGKATTERPTNHHDQMTNKSCTVLLEVTNACNLACRVCYADAKGDRILTMSEIREFISALVHEKGFLDSVQITGGEATIHPQFWEIVEWLYRQDGIGKIYLPTNGVEFSKPEIAGKLRRYRDKILVLLQYDGSSKETNKALRRADTLRLRQRNIRTLDKLGVCMQLTMTIAQDISEEQIAWVVEQGLKHRHVRLVGMLPTFYTGRYELPIDDKCRPTLSTVVKAIADGMPEQVTSADFVPIPCSHPNCGWTTLFARRFGLLFNITQRIDLESVMNEVAYKTVLDKNEIHSVIGNGKSSLLGRMLTRLGRALIRPCDVFGVAIKPFMDRYNFDYDRVANCCHHVLNTRGELVSFCEYNTLLRESDLWSSKQELSGRHAPVANAVSQSFERD